MRKKQFKPNKLFAGIIAVIVIYVVLSIMSLEGSKVFSVKKFSEADLVPISQNPDLIFDVPEFVDDFLAFWEQEKGVKLYPLPIFNESPLSGLALYYPKEMPKNSENKGIIIMHPIDKNQPQFVSQRLDTPDEFSMIYIKYANVADYFERETCPNCRDVLMKVKVIDLETNVTETVFEDVADSRDNWKQAFIDLSTYKGRFIDIAVEAWAGGPCDLWCAEWLGIDKFYVGKLIKS